MSYLWHEIMNQIWVLLFVLGVIFGAIIWVGMAMWDGIRALFRRLSGEHEDESRQ